MSSFWNGWIVALTVANIVGALWLLWITSRRRAGDEKPAPDTTGHTWDGDLEEYNNPLPRWWLWMFYGTVAFSVGYLVLFPGLGSFQGTLGWSQERQWQAEAAAANAVHERELARFAAMDLPELQRDADAMRIARNLYAGNCAMCHGSDARGARGFPNLTASNWQWGRDPEAVLATIAHGRDGIMPPWGDALGRQGVEEVANYVYSLAGRKAPEQLVAAGRTKYQTFCSACHGADARGNVLLGAPDLTDAYWVYGGSIEAIRETIVAGRANQMPGHLDLLGEQRVRLLAAYVLGLGGDLLPTATNAATSAATNDAAAAPMAASADASGT